MECKINKEYLVKWYDLIVQGASADIECDVEVLEEKFAKRGSLFFTGKVMGNEMIINEELLSEVKTAVQKSYLLAKESYTYVLKKHNIDLVSLREELEKFTPEQVVHSTKEKHVYKSELGNENQSQLSLF